VAGGTAPVVVGIDAGGTRTRALARHGDGVVHQGEGGPGNPLSTSARHLARSFAEALDGCPDPAIVAVCAAGAAGADGRGRIERLIRQRFPGVTVVVAPDYVAALMAAGADADVVVVAGTGSVVCSRADAGTARVSGGHGWIVGDHGSAARLGRSVLDHHCAAAGVDATLAAAMHTAYGTSEPARLIAALHGSEAPAAFLARAAPVLTAAALDGHPWAIATLDRQMQALAVTTCAHVERWSHPAARIALCGGVWRSAAARVAFERAIVRRLPRASVAACATTPTEGAVALALEHFGTA
jgi:glucosamine kinase